MQKHKSTTKFLKKYNQMNKDVYVVLIDQISQYYQNRGNNCLTHCRVRFSCQS